MQNIFLIKYTTVKKERPGALSKNHVMLFAQVLKLHQSGTAFWCDLWAWTITSQSLRQSSRSCSFLRCDTEHEWLCWSMPAREWETLVGCARNITQEAFLELWQVRTLESRLSIEKFPMESRKEYLSYQKTIENTCTVGIPFIWVPDSGVRTHQCPKNASWLYHHFFYLERKLFFLEYDCITTYTLHDCNYCLLKQGK